MLLPAAAATIAVRTIVSRTLDLAVPCRGAGGTVSGGNDED